MVDKIKKKRCFHCNKKIGLIVNTCKCEKEFCIKCRLPEIHNCTFDHHKFEKEQLKKNLPKVITEKIIKI